MTETETTDKPVECIDESGVIEASGLGPQAGKTLHEWLKSIARCDSVHQAAIEAIESFDALGMVKLTALAKKLGAEALTFIDIREESPTSELAMAAVNAAAHDVKRGMSKELVLSPSSFMTICRDQLLYRVGR